MCGGSTCDGTCITGKFWGLWVNPAATGDPTDPGHFDHVAIHDFAVVDPSLPFGCKNQVGDVYDPTGINAPGDITDGTGNFELGFLGNISVADVSMLDGCTETEFPAYCSPWNELNLTQLLADGGKSVALGLHRNYGNNSGSGQPVGEPLDEYNACGNISTTLLNPGLILAAPICNM